MIKDSIGANAGHVWDVLENGEKSVKAVKKATKLSDKDLGMAMGWLAREGKVVFYELDDEMYLRLS